MALTSDQIDIDDTRVADFVTTVLEDAKASDVRLLEGHRHELIFRA